MSDPETQAFEQDMKRKQRMLAIEQKYRGPPKPGIAQTVADKGMNWLVKFATEKPKKRRMEA
jgi:hypothetical protein